MPDDRVRLARVQIRGLVQGVGYRAWTARQAQARGLGGWVRNRASGVVEAMFLGPPQAVEAMIEACRKGPRGAWVEAIEVEDGRDHNMRSRTGAFEVLPTE